MTHDLASPLRRTLLAGAAAFVPIFAAGAARAAGDVRSSPPLLAMPWDDRLDPARYLVSEKYDGVRAIWDGRVLRHRSGREVPAPPSFLRALPEAAIDGELWLGRGRFDALSAIVRRREPRPDEWAGVRYMAFEMPQAGGRFAERARRLAALLDGRQPSPLEAAPQWRVADRDVLMRQLRAVVAGGGEGLMLHLASSPVQGGRSADLRKLKPHLDAEAVVVAWHPGRGKYRHQLGALEVETDEGRRFLVGSGLTDAERRDPPPIGSTITYRYRDLTATGLPRFATFLRRHVAD